jgi:hypothetical protein
MSDPVYQGTNQGYFTCDRDPTTSEPVIDSIPFPSPWLIYWWNQTSNNIFQCVDLTASAMIWQQIATTNNIFSIINILGWEINTSRNYSLRSSPAFATSYQPSVTNDTQVSAVISLTSTLITAATVDLQVDTGGGFSTISQISVSGLSATAIHTITCLVPANAHYKLIQVSGTSSIVSINEIQL